MRLDSQDEWRASPGRHALKAAISIRSFRRQVNTPKWPLSANRRPQSSPRRKKAMLEYGDSGAVSAELDFLDRHPQTDPLDHCRAAAGAAERSARRSGPPPLEIEAAQPAGTPKKVVFLTPRFRGFRRFLGRILYWRKSPHAVFFPVAY